MLEQIGKDNKSFAQKLLDIRRNSGGKNISLLNEAAQFACSSSTQFYCSDILESILAEESNNIQVKSSSDFIDGSVLHILSASFDKGGHTQVVARWVNQCKNFRHDIILTRQKVRNCAKSLKSLVDAGLCSIESLHEVVDLVNKASALRLKASKYEYIVLHIHMDDIVPSLAFAANDFKRPVFLFNHADHLFWVGAGVADLVLETRQWGKIFSNNFRGIKNNLVVGLPGYNNYALKSPTKEVPRSIKEKIGGREVILSSGLAHKYVSMKGNKFPEICSDILNGSANTVFVFVGINVFSHSWCEDLERQFPNRVVFCGVQEHWVLIELMKLSKLYIDSSPMSGGTALYDAIKHNVACISYKSVTGHLDPSVKSGAVFEDPEDFVIEALELLSNDNYRKKHVYKADLVFKRCGLHDNWANKLAKIMKSYSSKTVQKLVGERPQKELTELDLFIAKYLMTKKTLLRFGDFFSVRTWKYNSTRNYEVNCLKIHFVFSV